MEENRVVLDAGHGGNEPGAVYEGRMEKDDNLQLALAVGQKLSDEGVNVSYTRVTDVYQSPLEKAQMANRWGADYFVSFHRNAMPVPGEASGIQSLIYEAGGEAERLAQNLNGALTSLGFADKGIIERPGLIVLRRTEMPAVLVEAGFLDNQMDNDFFDAHFEEIAGAIASAILKTIQEEDLEPEYYQVQVGVFSSREDADRLYRELEEQGLPVFLVAKDGRFHVRVGAYLDVDNAAWMEKTLRAAGYPTVMIKEKAVS